MKPNMSGDNLEKVVKIGGEPDKKPVLSYISLYGEQKTSIDMTPTEDSDEHKLEFEHPQTLWTGHYVYSVLTTICCFGPLSVIGLVHFIWAQTEHRLGNTDMALRTKKHAKAWTSMAWVFGLFITLAMLASYFWFAASNSYLHHNGHRRYTARHQSRPMSSRHITPFFMAELEHDIGNERRRTSPRTTEGMFIAELSYDIKKEQSRSPPATTAIYIAELDHEMKEEQAKSRSKTISATKKVRTTPASGKKLLGSDWRSVLPDNMEPL